MTAAVLNYTVNPIWSGLKTLGKKFIAAQERAGAYKAATYLASMGYHKEAKDIMMKL